MCTELDRPPDRSLMPQVELRPVLLDVDHELWNASRPLRGQAGAGWCGDGERAQAPRYWVGWAGRYGRFEGELAGAPGRPGRAGGGSPELAHWCAVVWVRSRGWRLRDERG